MESDREVIRRREEKEKDKVEKGRLSKKEEKGEERKSLVIFYEATKRTKRTLKHTTATKLNETGHRASMLRIEETL